MFTIAVDIAGLEHVALAGALIQTVGGISVITASVVTGKNDNYTYGHLYIYMNETHPFNRTIYTDFNSATLHKRCNILP